MKWNHKLCFMLPSIHDEALIISRAFINSNYWNLMPFVPSDQSQIVFFGCFFLLQDPWKPLKCLIQSLWVVWLWTQITDYTRATLKEKKKQQHMERFSSYWDASNCQVLHVTMSLWFLFVNQPHEVSIQSRLLCWKVLHKILKRTDSLSLCVHLQNFQHLSHQRGCSWVVLNMFEGKWVASNRIERNWAFAVHKPNLAACSSDPLTFDIPTRLAWVPNHLFSLSRHKPDEGIAVPWQECLELKTQIKARLKCKQLRPCDTWPRNNSLAL